jgi:hypothetical protein
MERDGTGTGTGTGTAAAVVAVRGEEFREVLPEIATFSVTVDAWSRDRQEALRQLTGRVESLREVMDGYRDAIEARETAGLFVYPETKRSSEKVSGYRAGTTTTVTVADFTVLGDLMLRLADHERTAVGGPWWALRPGSPVHREARTAAIGDAIARAREYAAALGARVTRLIELSDVGMAERPAVMARAMAFAGHAAPGEGGPQLDLEPRRQQVRAAIEARFSISEPTVLDEPPAR